METGTEFRNLFAKTLGTALLGVQNGGEGIHIQRKWNGSSWFASLTDVMAAETGEAELEDGEINDLEDGEIDEDI